LVKVPTRSETRLVVVKRTIKVPEDEEKDVAKAKAKARKGPGVSLPAPVMVTQLRQKPLSIS
jgi:hypothetical protein